MSRRTCLSCTAGWSRRWTFWGSRTRSFSWTTVASDQTPRLIDELQEADPNLSVVHLSRNFGHQPAVSAGLDHASGKAVIVMDGDLQDPPEVIPQFVERWRAGTDVVYAVRRRRKEGAMKRMGYHAFYRILNAISDLDIPLDSGDFCLMDRRVVDALRGLPERARFVRGLRTFVGFRQTGLDYERAAREAGRPKYSLKALVGLAVDGLVSFSSYPLRLVTYLGVCAAVLALGGRKKITGPQNEALIVEYRPCSETADQLLPQEPAR